MTTPTTIVSKTKRESELQDIIMSIFKDYGHKTINEDLNKTHDAVLQEHQYLVLSPLENLTKGLRHYIKKFNRHIIEDKELLENNTQEDIITYIEKEFIDAYDASNYLGIYRLVFQERSQERNIEIDGKPYQYNLINFHKPVENEVFVIKERRIQKNNGGFEKPDFAIYMNGIPVFAIEVKTRKAGLNEAFKDYKNKTTYQKFIGCIGTDLDHTFIAMDPTAPCTFRWKAYGENKNPQQRTPLNIEELLCEILPAKNGPKGLLFYIQNCSFILEDEGDAKIINHRCQQYYTIKKLDTMLKNIETSKEDGKRDSLLKEVVKHAQRSGKSITILSLVNLLATKYPNLFSKVYIFVPDLTILSVLQKAFGKQAIPGTGKPLQVVKSISQYERTIEVNEKGLTVYLMNIQKSRVENKTYPHNDALILIDEVHTHQNGLGAESRDINFPHASYVSFTATPRFKSLQGELVDVTSTTYGKTPTDINEISYLDEFNMSDALELGIVAKLHYEKANIVEEWNKEMSADFEKEINESTRLKVESTHELRENVFIRQEEAIKHAQKRFDNGLMTATELEEMKERSYEDALMAVQSKLVKEANSSTALSITQSTIENKVDFIVSDMEKKRENLALKESDGLSPFKTKALWFVQNTKVAKKIINHIKVMSGSPENQYKGIRFGIDFSEQALNDSEINDSEKAKKEVDALNSTYLYGDNVLSDFESQEDYAIDVLIVVGKYLMGYDLGTLMTVYLDTEIREPAKFFQMATRPVTNYPKKNVGYLVDMTMGETNYDTFLTSIRYYDNDNRMDAFVLKAEDIATEQEIIEQNLRFISSIIFNVNGYNEIMAVEPERYVDILLNEKDASEQMSFFKRLKNINTSFNNLVTPEYYREYIKIFSYLLVVAKMYYKELFNKDEAERFLFDPKFITEVIEEAMESLNIVSFEQLARYSIIGSKRRLYKDEEDSRSTDDSDVSNSLSFSDEDNREERGVASIYDWLSNNSDKLDESIERQIRNRKKEEAGGEIEKEIEEDFQGDEMLYWVFSDFMEKMKKKGKIPELGEQTQGVFNEMVKDMLKGIVTKVWSDVKLDLYAVDESDVNDSIKRAYSRGETSHSVIKRYCDKIENQKDAGKAVGSYLNLFVSSESDISPELTESIITSIEIRREEAA